MKPQDLIGPVSRIYKVIRHRIDLDVAGQDDHPMFLLWGTAGTGKTSAAQLLADYWADSPIRVEQINGQELTVERVTEWRHNLPYRPLPGQGRVLVRFVDEIDAASPAALGQLRTWYDQSQQGNGRAHGLIATTNKRPDELPESVNTRFYDRQVMAPTPEDIMAYLLQHREFPRDVAAAIVKLSRGNVRQAMIEARKAEDEMAVA